MLKTSKNFKIENLGIQEVDVYDIEVDDNHNFFANNILVHNSAYVCLEDLVNKMFKPEEQLDKLAVSKFISRFCAEKLGPVINKACEDFKDYMNNPVNVLSMARENIAESAIWTGKKRYAMSVLDSEGFIYDKPNIKVTGIEVVRSSTPKHCQIALKKALGILLTGTEQEYRDYFKQFKAEFKTLSPQEIAKPSGVDGIDKYSDVNGTWKSGTPIHVRASILFNNQIKKLTLEQKYGIISDNDQMKFLYLVDANPIGQNVIGFKERLPAEFKLDEYIDYETQFQKCFVEPISKIAMLIGWSEVPKIKATSFFN